MAAPDVALVGGDPADIIGILRDQIGVQIVQGDAHLAGMFLIDAEDDGFGETVGLLQKLGQMPGDGLGTGAQGNDPFEILGLILVVRNDPAVAVQIVLAGTPAGGVPFGNDTMHPVGRQKAVIDALPEAVFVERVAEVQIGVAIVRAQRGGGHSQLTGRLEVIENPTPGTVVTGAATVALVHDNQIEEFG